MKAAVIVCTYNAPRQLELVFEGISRQTRRPDELFIADDGSTPDTTDLVRAWADRLELPVHHVWQTDRGYRKPRIVNEAARRASAEHLIFLDGDSVPHSRWVEDHTLAAKDGRVLCGRRVKLGPELSPRVTADMVRSGQLELLTGPVAKSWRAKDTKRFMLGVRIPAPLARILHPRPRHLMGVNFSMAKATFEAVNGYDGSYDFAWREDYDLELRLLRAGYSFFPLLNRAIVYHLYHQERQFTPEIEAIHTRLEQDTHIRAPLGLDTPFDPET